MEDLSDTERYAPFEWTRVELTPQRSSALAAVAAHWEKSREGRATSKWSTAELECLPSKLLSFCTVADTGNGEPPFLYRFFGTGLANMHTFELSRKTTDSIEPEGFRHLCVDQNLMVINEQKPLTFMTKVPTKQPELYRNHLILRLPYSDDENHISQIMTIEETEDAPRDTWELFRTE